MQRVTGVLTSFLPSEPAGITDVRGQCIGFAEKSWPTCAQASVAVPDVEPSQAKREVPIRPSVKRIMKLTISLIYYLVRELSRFVMRLVGRPPERGLVILYYHGVPDAYRSNFVRQLESIRRTARVLSASHRGTMPSDKPNVAITFDDAYVSVAKNALPALAARGFHSTIFVPTAMLGGTPTWQMEAGSPDSFEVVMAAEQIASLSSPLVALGSHSRTHPRLSRLAPGEARSEIEGSRTELQELTKEEIKSFALPYGDHNASTIETCRSAGYEIVFSTVPAPVDTMDTAFVRGRVKADPFDGHLEFFLKYNGAYAWAPYLSALKRKLRGYRPSAAGDQVPLGESTPYKQSKRS
jgi:peptidoglycan/xylan/chitin deacetylase (PgdA/CDA1 family)